jgi:hypothetical protein
MIGTGLQFWTIAQQLRPGCYPASSLANSTFKAHKRRFPLKMVTLRFYSVTITCRGASVVCSLGL